jgi:glycosyltransferase involved in cell wall biosynthesis
VYEFVRLLARRHHVALLTYAVPGDDEKVKALVEVCTELHVVPRQAETDRGKRVAQLSATFSPQSYQRRSLYAPAMQAKLDELTRREPFDVIQVESSQLAGFTFDRRSAIVLDEHNIEYELLYRMARTEGSPVRRVYNWLECKKFRREETASWRLVSGCVSTSDRDDAVIRAFAPGTPTAVVPNAVNVDYFHPQAAAAGPGDGAALVMTGLMHYRPNIDGALYFVREIFPIILASRPDAVFYIVGAGAPDELKRVASRNVVVTDTVPDVRPYIQSSAVFVVPLRMGGGTRLKVLEGLAMEKPVVSTSIGCEGIDVVHGEHLLVADDPPAFAASVATLLADRRAAAALGKNGRRLVERQYRWDTVVGRLEQFYDRVLAAAGVGSG